MNGSTCMVFEKLAMNSAVLCGSPSRKSRMMAARDHATLLQEEVFSVQNEAINDRMYLLAIISALFLPLAFLTGLFGINVGGLPGLDDPNAFWWFSGSLVVIATGILVWMARRRWF